MPDNVANNPRYFQPPAGLPWAAAPARDLKSGSGYVDGLYARSQALLAPIPANPLGSLPRAQPLPVRFLKDFTRKIEAAVINPLTPVVDKASRLVAVGTQEFLSFGVVTPIMDRLIVSAMIAMGTMPHTEPASLTSLALTFTASFVASAGVTGGLFGGWSTEGNKKRLENFAARHPGTVHGKIAAGLRRELGKEWDEYFVKNAKGELIDANGVPIKESGARPVFDSAKWSKLTAMLHAYAWGGLVRGPKVVAELFPKGVPLLKDVPIASLPKSYGDLAGFGTEFATDIGLYFLFGAIKGDMDFGLLFVLSFIVSVIYSDTAVTISRKYFGQESKAIVWRQLFSLIKNPPVMIASSALIPGLVTMLSGSPDNVAATWAASTAIVTGVSLALWGWAKYGMEDASEIAKREPAIA